MVLVSFGCKQAELLEVFDLVNISALDQVRLSDGTLDVLLRPIFQYSNSSDKIVIIEEYWKITCEPSNVILSKRINDYDTLVSTGGEIITREAKYSLRCILPKGTTRVVLNGFFTAEYSFGNITVQLNGIKLPIT